MMKFTKFLWMYSDLVFLIAATLTLFAFQDRLGISWWLALCPLYAPFLLIFALVGTGGLVAIGGDYFTRLFVEIKALFQKENNESESD